MEKLNELQSYLTRLRGLMLTLIILCSIGSGNAWGETVKYAQTSTSAASVSSGTAPTGSSVSFSNTYSTKEQLTSGNNMVLTLTSLGGISISNITLSMKSNKSGGAGKLSYSTNGGSTWTYLVGGTSSAVQFNNAAWYGSYSTSYVNISKTVSLTNVTQLKIKIEATANSLYCQSFQLTYTAAASCAKKVTITKGTPETGGSFNLDKTGAQDCCDALTVTVSSIVAPSGKKFSAITQSGIASGVTIDQSAKTVTYAANTTGSSTINVTFESKGCTDHNGDNVISGTETSGMYGPVYPYYEYSTRQILYTRTDLGLAAGKKGTIKSIYFQYANASAMTGTNSVKIYMANTNLSALSKSGDYLTSFTEVYSGALNCKDGWNEITLTTPFDYNGIGNLVVVIDDNSNKDEGSSAVFKYHTTSPTTNYAQLYTHAISTNADPTAAATWTGSTETNNRPNTKFCIQEADMAPATVTLMDNGAELTEASAGAGVTLPSRAGCSGYTFAGWTKTWVTAQTSWTATAPTIIPAGSYTPAGNENLYPVYTKTEAGSGFSSYTKVTSAPSDWSGKYLISDGTSTATGAQFSSTALAITTLTPGTTEYTAYEFTITKNGNNNNYFIISPDGTYYVGYDSNTNLKFSDNPNTNAYLWTCQTSDPMILNVATTTRYIGVGTESKTDVFKAYSTSGTNAKCYLYKRIEGGSTTYYISVPNCCTPLGSINGSFSFSNESPTSVTVGVPSDYSDKNNANLQGYIFKRYAASTGGSAVETKETNSSSGTTATFNTGLVANTTYYYTIIAKHSSSSCNSEETSPRKSHTITSYIVSYAAGDGSGDNPGAHNPVLSGTSVTLKANTFDAPAGKEFAGWNDGTNDYDAGDSYSVTANKTMTAQWSCITPHISSQSISNANYLVGATPVTALSVTIDNGSYDYQWQSSSTENGEYSPVAGATSSSFTPPVSATSDLWYKCVITNTGSSCNTTATSNKAHIVVAAPSYRLWTAWANGNNCDGDICNTWDWTGGSYFVNYNSTNEWRISNFTIPDFEWDAVNQRQMIYNVAGKNATNTKFYDLALAVSQGSASVKKGPMPGAVGTLRMYDNSDQPNGYLGFLPNKYMIRFGTHDYVMSETSTTVWETAIQTLDAADLTNVSQFRVGVTNSSDEFVAINENCSLTNVTSMGQKSDAGDNWGSNIAAGDAGKRGKFRIWLDNASNNWNAHFVPYHRIIFKANYHDGAIGDEPADTYSVDVSVEETNSSIALASAPTAPAGYTFAGWFTDATGGTQRTGAQTISAGATADVTLYAHWTANANTAYTVKHYQQNIADNNYTLFATQNLTGTTDAEVTPAVNSYTGFTAPSTQTVTILGDGSRVVEYNYTRNSYNLTWNLGGGTTTTAGTGIASGVSVNTTSSVKYGASLTAPTVTKTGYGFSAWSPAKAATMPAEATSYTATWSATNYTITYNLNSGTNPGGAPTGFTIESSEITLPTPTRAGYRFDGWYANVGLTGDVQTTIPAGSTGNKTYWAKWTAKTDTYKTAIHTDSTAWISYASGYTATTSGAGYTIPNPGSVKKGAGSTCEDLYYHFAGWVADEHKASPSEHIIDASGTTDATGTTYWAVWKKEGAGGGDPVTATITQSALYDNGASYTKAYGDDPWTFTDNQSNDWTFKANCAKTGTYRYVQLRVYDNNNGVSYIQLPDCPGNISSIVLTVSSTSGNTSSAGGNTTTLYLCADAKANVTSPLASATGASSITLSPGSGVTTGYIKADGGIRIWEMSVTYATVSYTDPKVVCEACAADPVMTNAASALKGDFSLSSVGVTATGWNPGTNCAWVEKGFVWGSSANPTVSNNKVTVNTGTSATWDGALVPSGSTNPTSLSVGTTYHFRAYGKNGKDAAAYVYSADQTFTPRSVSLGSVTGGTISANTAASVSGKTITLTATPDSHFSFGSWTVYKTGDESTTVSVSENSFTMPDYNVTITATFIEDAYKTVVFKNNGVEKQSGKVYVGERPSAPTLTDGSSNDACDATSDKHYGWTQTKWTNTIASKSTIDAKTGAETVYLKGSDLPVVAAGDAATITYHAVWAEVSGTPSDEWQLVTSTASLDEGDRVVLGYNNTGTIWLLGYQYITPDVADAKRYYNRKYASNTETVSDSKITLTSSEIATTTGDTFKPYVLTVGKSGSYWTFYDAVYGGYLYAAGTTDALDVEFYNKNLLMYQAVLTDAGKWALSINNTTGAAAFTSQTTSGTDRNLLKSNGSTATGVFSSYKSNTDGAAEPYIFKNLSTTSYQTFLTSCCDELITLSDPSIDGSGCTITFDQSSPVATCDEDVEIEATVTVTPGFRVTALSFSGGDVVIDPSISTPLTSSQTYTLSFAQHTTATLTTTATVEALRDEYYDYMHDNVKKYNKDGNYNTVPTLSSKPAADDSGCKDDHYKFKGWVVEDEINENGTLKDGYTLILGGTTGKYATGKKYYAVWAEEE